MIAPSSQQHFNHLTSTENVNKYIWRTYDNRNHRHTNTILYQKWAPATIPTTFRWRTSSSHRSASPARWNRTWWAWVIWIRPPSMTTWRWARKSSSRCGTQWTSTWAGPGIWSEFESDLCFRWTTRCENNAFANRCQIPDIYKKISKEVCEADATAVEMGRMNKYFYEFGRYVTRFDRVGYIGPMLVDVSAPTGDTYQHLQ